MLLLITLVFVRVSELRARFLLRLILLGSASARRPRFFDSELQARFLFLVLLGDALEHEQKKNGAC